MATPDPTILFEPSDPLDYLQPECPCAPHRVRQVRLLVFDDYISTNILTFFTTTPATFKSLLGAFDQLAIEAVVDDTNSGGMQLEIDLQHSADGVTWATKSTLVPDLARLGQHDGLAGRL